MPQKKDSPDTKTQAATAPTVPDQLLAEIGGQTAAKPAKKAKVKTTKTKPASPAKSQPAESAPTAAVESRSTDLDDPATDEAVKDIATEEADVMLTLQDVASEAEATSQPQAKPHWFMLIILLSILAALILGHEWLAEQYQNLNINF